MEGWDLLLSHFSLSDLSLRAMDGLFWVAGPQQSTETSRAPFRGKMNLFPPVWEEVMIKPLWPQWDQVEWEARIAPV